MNNTKRINSLKDRGFKVYIEHYRLRNDTAELIRHSRKCRNIPTDKLNSKGGETIVTIDSPSGGQYIGTAICNPIDPFCYRLGTTIALNRAEFAINKDNKEE